MRDNESKRADEGGPILFVLVINSPKNKTPRTRPPGGDGVCTKESDSRIDLNT